MIKWLLVAVVGVFLSIAEQATTLVHTEINGELALQQFAEPTTVTQVTQQTLNTSYWPYVWLGYCVLSLWFLKDEVKKMFKSVYGLLVLCILATSGCVKPYHEATMVDIGTSEVAFLVETVNANGQSVVAPVGKGGAENQGEDVSQADFYQQRLINARKVEIPYYWKQTRRVFVWADSTTGEWHPAARLITVNTAPETREWTADTHSGTSSSNQGIWVESADSVGFSTGISVTANISNKEDAILFLSNYPPEGSRKIETKGGVPFNVEVTALNQIMDREIRSKVQEIYSYVASGFSMDDLRDKKQYIIDIVKNGGEILVLNPDTGTKDIRTIDGVVPYFKKKGISILALGQFGGFTYENPEIQKSIDAVFQAQQDEEVAKAEAKAAEQRKMALKLKGEGEAAQVLEARRGEAEGIKLVADAKAYELSQLQENPEAYLALKQLEIEQTRLERWDGKYPTTLFGGNADTPGMLLNFTAPQ